jgi:hypothetical protein
MHAYDIIFPNEMFQKNVAWLLKTELVFTGPLESGPVLG